MRQMGQWDFPKILLMHIGILAPDKNLYKEKFEKALANEIRADNLYEDLSIRPIFNSASTGLTLFDSALIYDAFLILNYAKQNIP